MTNQFENLVHRAPALGHQLSPSSKGAIDLVIGPYRSGKTLKVIDELIDFCRANPFASALVIVPSQRYRTLFEQRLQDRLQKRATELTLAGGVQGIVGLQILPFYKACEFVLRKVGVPFQLIPEQVRAAVIAQVVSDLRQEGLIQTLEPIINYAGTHSALLELIDELQRAALLPEQITAKLQLTAQSESRFIELTRIYQRYCDHLSTIHYIDERGLAFAARSLLTQNKINLSLGMVAADGFDRFNPLQLHVLDGLSRHAHQTSICFDYVEPERDLAGEYSWKEHSFTELQSAFHKASVKKVERSPEIVDPANRTMFRTLDRFFESAEVARQIKQRIVDGAKPGDFLVVARSINSYNSAIHAAFDGAGVNYFFDESVAINSLPCVQFVTRLLELASQHDFKRNVVMATLRSANFNIAMLPNAEKDLNRIDRFSLDSNVVGGIEQWDALLLDKQSKISPEFATGLKQFFQSVRPPEIGTLRDFIVWTENLLDKYFVFATESDDDQFQRWEEHRAVGEIRRCLASLLHEQNICGESSCTADYFLSRLRLLLERANFRRLPRNSDCVTICSADLAPNKLYQEVFILGLAEGEFPKRSRQSGFLSSDEVAKWLSFGIDIRNPRFHAAFEPALFSSLTQRAKKSISLSCPVFSTSGEELLASYLMTGGDEEAVVDNVPPFAQSGTSPISARDAVSGVLWHAADSDIGELRSMLPLTTLVEALADPLYIARARTQNAAGLINGDLRELVATRALPLTVPTQWSASRLNDYGKCPFKYWLNHTLRVQPVEEPEAKLHPMVLGNTYHEALEIFYKLLIAKKLKLGDLEWPVASEIFQQAIVSALASLDKKSDVRRGEFWRYELNEISFRLKRFFLKEYQRAQQDQDRFIPSMTEASFGFPHEGSHPALTIKSGSREIVIRGRIDRLDITESTVGTSAPRVRVIDYKTGSTPITKDDALSGRNIQLPLYALAVQKSILTGSKAVSGQYLGVNSGEPTGRLSFEPNEKQPDSPDILEKVQEHIKSFVNGIASGDFSVRPNGRSVCSKCEHKSVCRVAELPETIFHSKPAAGQESM